MHIRIISLTLIVILILSIHPIKVEADPISLKPNLEKSNIINNLDKSIKPINEHNYFISLNSQKISNINPIFFISLIIIIFIIFISYIRIQKT
jgi:hypothetical protein